MTKFSKKFLVFAIFLLFLFGLSLSVRAAGFMDDFNQQLGSAGGEQGAGFSEAVDPRIVAAYYIRIALGVLGIGFIILTVYAGAKILTSQGEADKIDEGKNTLKNSIIGLIIILSAYSITTFAVRLVTGDAARQGDYVEIRDDPNINPDPANAGMSPNAFSPI